MTMEAKRDYSFGVVPYRQTADGKVEVCLINQRSHRGDIYWTFPKGHKEGGESSEETAVRELKEETGLVAKLDSSKNFRQHYSFVHEGYRVEKEVSYFLGEVSEGDFTLQPAEVAEARWCSFAEAKALLTHNVAKVTLGEIQDYLTRK